MSNELIKYGTTDLDAMREEREEYQREKEAMKSILPMFTPAEGRNIIRILPPWSQNQRSPFFKTYLHYISNPHDPDAKGRPVVCPNKTRAGKCIVCAEVSRLRKTGAPADAEMAKTLRAGKRIYANILDTGALDKGVQVFAFGSMIYDFFMSVMAPEPPEEPIDITDPRSGFNIVLERSGKGLLTRYVTRLSAKPSALSDMSVLSKLHDLTKVVSPMDDAKIRAVLEGREDDAAEMAPEADDADDARFTPAGK